MPIQRNIFCATLLLALLLPACATPNNTLSGCSDPKVFCVGLVTDVGMVKDSPNNQALLAALQQAKDKIGAQTAVIETAEALDYPKNIAYFTDAGYDVIVTAGAQLGKATFQAAADHPTIKFIGIDQYLSPDKPTLPNLQTVTYPRHYLVGDFVAQATRSEALSPDQAGFLVGAIAARITGSQKIGAVCPPNKTPLLQLFCEGYKAGAAYISPHVVVTVEYSNFYSINIIKLTQEPNEAETTMMENMAANGIDLVFNARENQVEVDIVAEAARLGVDAIGVDSDQSLSLAEVKEMFDATRPITPILFELLKQAKDSNFTSGAIYPDNAVEYVPFQELISQLPAELKKEIVKIQTDLLSGALQTTVVVSQFPTPEATPPPAP